MVSNERTVAPGYWRCGCTVRAVSAILLTGGTVRTLDDARPVADELLVVGDRIAERCDTEPQRIDLRGGCVVPGFTDSHTHFPTWAMAQGQVRLEGARTIEEALDHGSVAAPPPPAARR